MSAGWRLAVDGDALRLLLGAKARERQVLLDAFDQLVREPHQPVDFLERSPKSTRLQRENIWAVRGNVLARTRKNSTGCSHRSGYR